MVVNNFKLIEELLTFKEPGDCYYIQLLRRQSDDPLINGKPDPNYHGNMHSRSFKDYLITSVENLEEIKRDIITACEHLNVRAYIRLNKRNFKKISLFMLRRIAEQEISGQNFCSPFRLVSSAAGLANCATKSEKTWIVDIDKEYMPHQYFICKMICQCDPIDKELKAAAKRLTSPNDVDELYKTMLENEIAKIKEIPTKSGKHLIVHPFHKERFIQLWEEYVVEKCVTEPLPQFKLAEDTIHFSLTGPYLKHANSFLAICQTSTLSAKMERIDKNKAMIHLYANYKDHDEMLERIREEWKEWCKKSEFYFGPPDVHEDNPTILYVP
jgi:hypothetical protein